MSFQDTLVWATQVLISPSFESVGLRLKFRASRSNVPELQCSSKQIRRRIYLKQGNKLYFLAVEAGIYSYVVQH